MNARARIAIAACTAAALVGGLAGCSSDSDGAAATQTPAEAAASTSTGQATAANASAAPPDIPLLGVVNATAGTYEDGTLTLTGVSPAGVWFTDRPTRDAGTSPIAEFLPLFFDDDTDPPNAAIETTDTDGEATTAIVELSDPEWDAETGELTLTATLIDDVEDARIAEHPSLAPRLDANDGALPDSFGPAALFIDTGNGLTPTQDGGLTPSENPASTTTTTQGTPNTPSVAPSAAAVQTLATDTTAVTKALESLITKLRVSIDEDPSKTCGNQLLQQAFEVYENTLKVLQPQVSALQQAVSDDDGVLPASEDQAFEDASSYLTSVQNGADQVSLEYGTCFPGS